MTRDEAINFVLPMPFKKHKNKTIGQVWVDDPQYLEWLHREVDADKFPQLFEALDIFMED